MAQAFGADPRAARFTAARLAAVRAELVEVDRRLDFLGATGSARVEQALTEFADLAGEHRRALDGLLERAAGLLDALATGIEAVDGALAAALAAGERAAAGSERLTG